MSALPASNRDPLFERILERSARALGGAALHPLEIIAEVERACLDSVHDEAMPNQITVAFHAKDFASFRAALSDLRWEIDRTLERIEKQYGYTRIGDRSVFFETAESAALGTVQVTARFADTNNRPKAAPKGATQTVQRQTATIVLADGRTVPLTHTPFSIGRAPGNDIVLVSLAVSRRHAQIIETPEGLVLEDLGSTNGLSVDGLRRARILLLEGTRVQVGDVQLWLEPSA